MARTRTVHAHWDQDAKVWWAESEDVPGLVSESATLDGLTDNILVLVPELIALNESGHEEIAIELIAHLPHRAPSRAA